jgi:hypothetical protein
MYIFCVYIYIYTPYIPIYTYTIYIYTHIYTIYIHIHHIYICIYIHTHTYTVYMVYVRHIFIYIYSMIIKFMCTMYNDQIRLISISLSLSIISLCWKAFNLFFFSQLLALWAPRWRKWLMNLFLLLLFPGKDGSKILFFWQYWGLNSRPIPWLSHSTSPFLWWVFLG